MYVLRIPPSALADTKNSIFVYFSENLPCVPYLLKHALSLLLKHTNVDFFVAE